jgi:non-homologous end joining protein Ku
MDLMDALRASVEMAKQPSAEAPPERKKKTKAA